MRARCCLLSLVVLAGVALPAGCKSDSNALTAREARELAPRLANQQYQLQKIKNDQGQPLVIQPAAWTDAQQEGRWWKFRIDRGQLYTEVRFRRDGTVPLVVVRPTKTPTTGPAN